MLAMPCLQFVKAILHHRICSIWEKFRNVDPFVAQFHVLLQKQEIVLGSPGALIQLRGEIIEPSFVALSCVFAFNSRRNHIPIGFSVGFDSPSHVLIISGRELRM
jgi:hypothetical protein